MEPSVRRRARVPAVLTHRVDQSLPVDQIDEPPQDQNQEENKSGQLVNSGKVVVDRE
ncbi:MAG: hypothetical protein QXH67_00140 [Candidatus Bathyarchaeia archaeon]